MHKRTAGGVLASLGIGVVICAGLAASLLTMPGARQARVDGVILSQLLNVETQSRAVVGAARERAVARVAAAPGGCVAGGTFPIMVFTARLAEEALQLGRFNEATEWQLKAIDTARANMRCNPADGLSPVLLTRFRALTEGPQGGLLPALRLSYQLAPREAWIMLRRAHVAMMLRPVFEDEDTSRLMRDIVGLVESGLIAEAVELLRGVDRPTQVATNVALAVLPASLQKAYQRRAAVRGVETEGLSIPALPDRFR